MGPRKSGGRYFGTPPFRRQKIMERDADRGDGFGAAGPAFIFLCADALAACEARFAGDRCELTSDAHTTSTDIKTRQYNMDIYTISHQLGAKSIGRVEFVSESDSNTCRECGDNNGRIFDIDDPNMPQLPIHPHCRCKYVLPGKSQMDVTSQVEKYRITRTLISSHHISEAEAGSLAEQVITARTRDHIIRYQKLFLLFNGRYLMSSDGKLLLTATSGKPISVEERVIDATLYGLTRSIKRTTFDYSYERQGIEEIFASGSISNIVRRKRLFSKWQHKKTRHSLGFLGKLSLATCSVYTYGYKEQKKKFFYHSWRALPRLDGVH